MTWTDNLNAEELKTVAYIREQVKRIGELHNVKLSGDSIKHIYYFADEHSIDSHALCDVIELAAKIITEFCIWEI